MLNSKRSTVFRVHHFVHLMTLFLCLGSLIGWSMPRLCCEKIPARRFVESRAACARAGCGLVSTRP